MTRFREEHYAKWRKGPQVQRGNHAGDPFVAPARTPTWGEERRALRSEFFKKKSKTGAKGAKTHLLKWELDG